ncbi:MAG: tRNA (adenosine(37)-N6)-threonylcarbamoyltransferase complex ATPase subunit type 1 TsaE [Candidatus Omnitrophica bacterium]|nr:tRNA (adenosine(37)-N6)-threonylcarbamoyltransferase complex ATPase subunit type 1 TsaE [Candidatus Omnitrophota bacterium]
MNKAMDRTVTTDSPEKTMELGAKVAGTLSPGDLVALTGDLGTGKTMFVKGMAEGLGIPGERVNSPSFVILREYAGTRPLYHFDVYRLDEDQFAETVDYRMYFYGAGLSVVEWADKIEHILPEEYLRVDMAYGQKRQRRLRFTAQGNRFAETIGSL